MVWARNSSVTVRPSSGGIASTTASGSKSPKSRRCLFDSRERRHLVDNRSSCMHTDDRCPLAVQKAVPLCGPIGGSSCPLTVLSRRAKARRPRFVELR